MFKIALNAGHGINTSGKRCLKSIDANETREWVLNSRICRKIEEKLSGYSGYSLIRLDDTSGNTDVPLKQRTDKANKFGADFYLSIHHNAGIKGGNGGGIIAIVYTTISNSSVTAEWQKALYERLIDKTGLNGNRSQPLQKKDLHEVRESKMPAVLLECGFMDSTTDTPIILTEDYADKVATACVEVLAEKGGLFKIQSTISQVNTTEIKKSIDEIAREVIKGIYGNGTERKTKIQNMGYDYVAVQKKVAGLLGNFKTTVNQIKVGATVKIKNGATFYGTTKKVPLWTLLRKYKIKEIKGSRVVLTYNNTAVFGAVDKKFLYLV